MSCVISFMVNRVPFRFVWTTQLWPPRFAIFFSIRKIVPQDFHSPYTLSPIISTSYISVRHFFACMGLLSLAHGI